MVKVVPAPSGEGPPVVVVRFSEWPKVQETRRTQVVALTEVPNDEGATESEGCCELCGRQMQLTFHHLLPKETHARCPSKLEPVAVPRPLRGPVAHLGPTGRPDIAPRHRHATAARARATEREPPPRRPTPPALVLARQVPR